MNKIPSANLSTFYAEIEKLNKRAKRNHLAPITVCEHGTEIVENEDRAYVVHLIEVVGESPVLNGWQFLAIIEHNGEDTIIRALPGATSEGELAGYRGSSAKCEHCKRQVRRKYTAIVKNEQGEYKQVGKACLKDFVGHKSIATIVAIAEELQKVIEGAEATDDDLLDGYSNKSLIPLKRYLSYVVASVRKYGFVSRKQVMDDFSKVSTADDALTNMYPRGYDPEYRPTEEDVEKAQRALTWIDALEGDMSDYLHNLRAVSHMNAIDTQHIGIAASLISAYHKACGESSDKATKKTSEWQGQTGDKLTIKKAIVKMMSCSPSLYARGKYTYFYILEDENGNVYKYVASADLMEEGQTYDLTGTIKDHSQYGGVRQTVITRCKVTATYETVA